jgi:hypothetical protein
MALLHALEKGVRPWNPSHAFSYWWVCAIGGCLWFVLAAFLTPPEESGYGHKLARTGMPIRVVLRLFLWVAGLLLVELIVALAYGWLLWSPEPGPDSGGLHADYWITPESGAFQAGDTITFTVYIENRDDVPLTVRSIYFPFSDGVIDNYLEASHPVGRTAKAGGTWTEDGSITYSLDWLLAPGEYGAFSVPNQFVTPAIRSGSVKVGMSATRSGSGEKLGPFGGDWREMVTGTAAQQVDWVVQQ